MSASERVQAALAAFDDPLARPEPSARASWLEDLAFLRARAEHEDLGAELLHRARTSVARHDPALAAVPRSVWELGRGCAPEARHALVRTAIERGVHLHTVGGSTPSSIGELLARLTEGDDELGTTLLKAVLQRTDHELKHPGYRGYAVRVADTLRGLGDLTEDPRQLEVWAEILPESARPRLAAVTRHLAPRGLAGIDALVGITLDDDLAPGLCAALAERWSFYDAIEAAARLRPLPQQLALLAIAERTSSPAHRQTLVTCFRRCPAGDPEEDYDLRFGSLFLRVGDVDGAIATLRAMGDRRSDWMGPASLALEIAGHLADHPEEATTERVQAVLAAPHAIPQALARVVTRLVYRLAPLTDVDAAVTKLRARFEPGDAGLVDAGEAAARFHAGDTSGGREALERALRVVRENRPLFFTVATYLDAARHGRVAEAAPDLLERVLEAIPLSHQHGSSLVKHLDPIGRRVTVAHLPELPAALAHELAVALAETADLRTERDLVETLVERAPGRAETLTLGRCFACVLARAGELDEARAVARLVGL
ncbi:MAG: hypothetical protein H6719_34310 [Sandaracinaceae bacterium]|nr:hypothetical protein [Sandaracinaceae bacterium]